MISLGPLARIFRTLLLCDPRPPLLAASSRTSAEVRPAELHAFSPDALRTYLKRDAEKQAPLTSWASSPNGPLARAQFYALLAVDAVIGLHVPIERATGLPQIAVFFGMLIAFISLLTVGLMACAAWMGPVKARPAAAAHPHRD